MKRNLFWGFLLSLLLVACGKSEDLERVLGTADSLITVSPDSAFHYLEAHSTLKPEGSRSQRMRYELLRATAQNKAYVDFTTDSVMKQVADYYDHHGTANQQLQAHYLLGCVYRDLGELPHAVDCYLEAIDRADTTEVGCDFRTLGNVYSELANTYHFQLLLSFEIDARKQAFYYTMLSGDTLGAINDLKWLGGTLLLQGKKDSAEIILNKALSLYRNHGYLQDAIKSSTVLMSLYAEQPLKQSELKQLIDSFESKCNLFDNNHQLPSTKRQYYYYKGRYYENAGKLDSAELCYRKIYYPNISYMAANPMYKGLLSVFQKRRDGDSIAKYSELYCMSNDSSAIIKDQEMTTYISANYNYTRYQKEAQANERKAYSLKTRLVILSTLFIVFLLFSVYLYGVFRKKRSLERSSYNAAIAERNMLQKELETLKENNNDSIILQKEEIIKELNLMIEKYEASNRQEKTKDRLTDFENSEIAMLFSEKAEFKLGNKIPNASEWKLLEKEFRRDMPAVYSIVRTLSPLQLHVSILLILGYEESVIALLNNTSPQTINNAKVHINKKLFNTNKSSSLRSNLHNILNL